MEKTMVTTRWNKVQALLSGRLMQSCQWLQLVLAITMWVSFFAEIRYLESQAHGMEGLGLILAVIDGVGFGVILTIALIIRLLAYHKVALLARTRILHQVSVRTKDTQAGFVILLEAVCCVPLLIQAVRRFWEMLHYEHTLAERLLDPILLAFLLMSMVILRSVLHIICFHRLLCLSNTDRPASIPLRLLTVLMVVIAVHIVLAASLIVSWWWNWMSMLLAVSIVYGACELCLLFRCRQLLKQNQTAYAVPTVSL